MAIVVTEPKGKHCWCSGENPCLGIDFSTGAPSVCRWVVLGGIPSMDEDCGERCLGPLDTLCSNPVCVEKEYNALVAETKRSHGQCSSDRAFHGKHVGVSSQEPTVRTALTVATRLEYDIADDSGFWVVAWKKGGPGEVCG